MVAALGESQSPPWWRSEATSPVGRRMLERLFPRTVLAASLETASRTASLEHDTRIGRVGAYHLFRLRIADEAAIRERLHLPDTTSRLAELAALADAQARLEALATLAGSASAAGSQGPVFCGAADASRRDRTLQAIAASYVAGFRSGTPVYPYLDGGV
ncbi:MAG: BrxE family protein [Chloroflexi bacterium]|nr:BrxE family protein [Chloroflexota bacterium]